MGPFGVVCSGRGVFVLDVIASIAGIASGIAGGLREAKIEKDLASEPVDRVSSRLNRSIRERPFEPLRAILRRFFLGLNAINLKSPHHFTIAPQALLIVK